MLHIRLETVYQHIDSYLIHRMRTHGVSVLRFALALVFIWFGCLKAFQLSPVSDLVAKTVYWFSPEIFVPILGVVEIIVGVCLLLGIALRATLLVFWLHLAGTFLVLFIRPDIAFQHGNPLLLTTEGEFVVKNLVLMAAGIVVGSHLKIKRK